MADPNIPTLSAPLPDPRLRPSVDAARLSAANIANQSGGQNYSGSVSQTLNGIADVMGTVSQIGKAGTAAGNAWNNFTTSKEMQDYRNQLNQKGQDIGRGANELGQMNNDFMSTFNDMMNALKSGCDAANQAASDAANKVNQADDAAQDAEAAKDSATEKLAETSKNLADAQSAKVAADAATKAAQQAYSDAVRSRDPNRIAQAKSAYDSAINNSRTASSNLQAANQANNAAMDARAAAGQAYDQAASAANDARDAYNQAQAGKEGADSAYQQAKAQADAEAARIEQARQDFQRKTQDFNQTLTDAQSAAQRGAQRAVDIATMGKGFEVSQSVANGLRDFGAENYAQGVSKTLGGGMAPFAESLVSGSAPFYPTIQQGVDAIANGVDTGNWQGAMQQFGNNVAGLNLMQNSINNINNFWGAVDRGDGLSALGHGYSSIDNAWRAGTKITSTVAQFIGSPAAPFVNAAGNLAADWFKSPANTFMAVDSAAKLGVSAEAQAGIGFSQFARNTVGSLIEAGASLFGLGSLAGAELDKALESAVGESLKGENVAREGDNPLLSKDPFGLGYLEGYRNPNNPNNPLSDLTGGTPSNMSGNSANQLSKGDCPKKPSKPSTEDDEYAGEEAQP
jgi:hypothetical protein